MTIREFYTLVGGSYDDMSERFPSDALNLGLTALAGVCSEMTEALRGSDTLPASAPALFEAVQREYDKVTGALVQLTA